MFKTSFSALAICLVLAGCNAGASAMGGVDQVGTGVGDAVAAPLEDLNLKRQEIPTILLHAESDPYDVRNMSRCSVIAAEIVPRRS